MKITINLNKEEIERYKSLIEIYDAVGIVGLESIDRKIMNEIKKELVK